MKELSKRVGKKSSEEPGQKVCKKCSNELGKKTWRKFFKELSKKAFKKSSYELGKKDAKKEQGPKRLQENEQKSRQRDFGSIHSFMFGSLQPFLDTSALVVLLILHTSLPASLLL